MGNNIRSIRKVLNMNQRDLCEKMKVTQQTVSNIENSEYIDNETLEKVAFALGVPSDVIKTYDHRNTINYLINNNTIASDNGGDATALVIDNSTVINNNPLDKIIELYENLLSQQKLDYIDLKNQLNDVIDELYNLKNSK